MKTTLTSVGRVPAIGLALALGVGLFALVVAGLPRAAAAAGLAEPAVSYACNEAGLNSALAAGGSATFNCAVSTTVTVSGRKTVSHSGTLDGGNKLILSGGNVTGVFTVAAGVNLSLLNLTLRDANAGIGGAIYNHGTVNTSHVLFFNNAAGEAAVLFNAAGAVANLSDTSVISNSAEDAAVWNGNETGPLPATLTVANSTFSHNLSVYGAAIYNQAGQVTVTGSNFNNNASYYGGAIYNNDFLRVDDSQFDDNQTQYFVQTGLRPRGDAPNGPALPAIATPSGGAIYVAPAASASVNGSSFDRNLSLQGGAIFNGNLLTVSASSFVSNTALITPTVAGGALYNHAGGRMSVVGSDFSFNQAQGGLGGAIGNLGALTVDYSHFTANSQSQTNSFGGGAIMSMPAFVVTGPNSKAPANPGASSGPAAPQGLIPNSLSVDHSTFTANTSDYEGGAIDADLAVVAHSTFMSNTAAYGGAIDELNTFTLTADTFYANAAVLTSMQVASQGGAIDTNANVTTIRNSTFYANHATDNAHGGAINAETAVVGAGTQKPSGGDPVQIFYSTFVSNTADNNGGGVSAQTFTGIVAMTDVLLAYNTGHDCLGHVDYHGANLEFGDATCGSASLISNPLALPPANNGGPTFTSALLPASPAINAGDNLGCPATDQRGAQRPVNGTCDLGAFEFGGIVARLWLPLTRR